MKAANPYLNFPGNTQEAFEYYRSVFGGEFLAVIRFGDFPGNPMGVAEEDLDKIAHIALPLGQNVLMATDVVGSMPGKFIMGTNSYIAVEPQTPEEADALFAGLSEGGSVEMPLQRTEWSEKYGVCTDRFGVQWMVDYTGEVEFSLPTGG
jgi:PhnB protein